jgi:hypothetical protein
MENTNLTFRAHLPNVPIISEEKDKVFVKYFYSEMLEKAKCVVSGSNSNPYFQNYTINKRFSYVFEPFIFLIMPTILFRRFHYKKLNTLNKSIFKTILICSPLWLMQAIYNSSSDYLNFLATNHILKLDEQELDEYSKFKSEYLKI